MSVRCVTNEQGFGGRAGARLGEDLGGTQVTHASKSVLDVGCCFNYRAEQRPAVDITSIAAVTMSDLEYRVWHLLAITSGSVPIYLANAAEIATVRRLHKLLQVNQTTEVLEQRLEEWPPHLEAEKELLRTSTCEAIAAESSEDWIHASQHYRNCLEILIANKPAIPQELLLWLAKRICVPLAFINQFRLKNFKVAYETLKFMCNYVNDEYDYGDRELTWIQRRLKKIVGIMVVAVLYDAKDDAEDVDFEYYNWLSTGDVQDLKAFCCEHLCVQYYRLGKIEDVWRWLGEWKRSLTCITADENMRRLQYQDCCIAEACFLLKHGEVQKAQEIMLNLSHQYAAEDENLQYRLPDLARAIFLRLGDADNADLELLKMDIFNETLIETEGLEEFRLELISLRKRAGEAISSAREEDAIGDLQRCIDIKKNSSCYRDDPSLPTSVFEDLSAIAVRHIRLFLQKELKFYIDSKDNDENYFASRSMSLKVCAHHCWNPYCPHSRHCLEEDESHFESPTHFFTKRGIESDGNNLHHLEDAVTSLVEALNLANELVKSIGESVLVADVHSLLARTYLLIAQNKYCRRIMLPVLSKSEPVIRGITPEVLVANDCRTIHQVQECLELNGISPEESFQLSHYHHRQCAEMFTKLLDSNKDYSDNLWIPMIEKHKEIYFRLQFMLFSKLEYYKRILDVLQEALRITGEDVSSCVEEFNRICSDIAPEFLLWSERGRARLLEFQLMRRKQPEIIHIMEPNRNDLSAFALQDEVAWDVIRSSLDACGEDTLFLEYSFDERSEYLNSFHLSTFRFGTVYAVKKGRGMVIEPQSVAVLTGHPEMVIGVIQSLHKALTSPKYVEAEVIRDLEVLYQLLISPVAEFLKQMQYEHKLVICPNDIFTKVPFAILRNPAEKSLSKGYLFQSHTISITSSLRVLQHNKERYLTLQNMELMEGQGAAVVIGDPAYKNPKMRLEHSREEVEFIASLFPKRCALVTRWDATVESLWDWTTLPSKRSCSQAFVHIAAHCETGDDRRRHGILRLTELDSRQPCHSSSSDERHWDLIRPDGTLSAESIVKSESDWRARMIVLSACSSGEGEIKAEGVLNLPRAFMVAGVPCSVVSQWPVEDGSTAQLMKFLYQKLLEGMDVTTALQSSMQQMLDEGSYNIKQWGVFMVWGLPTVCLPDELLSKGAGATFLQIGKELLESKRYSDARLPLKKSLEMMKANKDRTNNDVFVQCLCWLAECEEYFCSRNPETFSLQNLVHNLRFASQYRDDDFAADQFGHLDAAIQYLGEALQHAKVDGSVPPTQLDIHMRLGRIYYLRAGSCLLRLNVIPLPNIIDGIQAVLDTFQANDVSAVDSWRKAMEHYTEHAKLCSQNMKRLTLGSEHWVSAATSCNEDLLAMQNLLLWNRVYLHILKQHLIERHRKLTGDATVGMGTVRYTLEHRFLVSEILEKAMWLNRMYIPPWGLSLGWRTIDDHAAWDLLRTDSFKETCTLARCCGDVVVEYYALNDDPISQKFLLICVMSQVRPAHYFVLDNQDVLHNLDLVLTRTASMMSAPSNLKSHVLLKDLEYLYEVLIKPVRDHALKTLHQEQKLVFIPCECLAAVPFELLRDGAQPHGDGYLIQSHTFSVMPSFRMLEYCSQRLQDLQTLPLVPDSSASLFLSNPGNNSKPENDSDVGPAAVVASQFPARCSALHGSDATIEALVDWAELPSLTNMHCQAFFHIEAEIEDDSGMGVLKLANFQGRKSNSNDVLAKLIIHAIAENIEKPSSEGISEAGSGSISKDGRLSSEAIVKYGFQWRVHMAVLRVCESANGQIHKEGVLSVARAFLAVGVPCVVTSHFPVDDACSHHFFAHLYASMKDGDDVATAVRYSKLQMKKDGFPLNQWGGFSVFGAPNVRLPQEMLRSCEELLEKGRNLLDSHRYSEAILILKKSLHMLKAKDDDSIMKSFDALRWLGECEEGLFKSKHIQSLPGLKDPSVEFDYRLFSSPHQREALEPDQLIHLQSAIHYLDEALKVAQDVKKDMQLPIDQSIEKQLGLLHFLEGLCHFRRFESQIHTGKIAMRDSMKEMLLFLQNDAGLKCQDSWQTSAECFIQHLNLCSSVRDRETRYSEPWWMAVDSQIKTADLVLHVTQWEREYINTVYRYLLTTGRQFLGRVYPTEAILTKEFQLLTWPLLLREYWLERKSRVRWEIPIGRQSTRTFSEMDLSIEIGETCGEDPVILEYNLDLDVTNTITTLITRKLQESEPALYLRCVPIEEPQKLKRVLATLCPSMADKTKFNESECLKDLEYMYMLLIGNNTVNSTIKYMSLNQKLIIVPGKLLSVVPFALLRNPDQPQGQGYLFQSNTISIQPSLRILEHCCQRFKSMQSRRMMPGSKASLVIGCSTSTEKNESLCKRINEEEHCVASQFPNHCHCVDMRELVASRTHVDSLLDWAELPFSSKEDYSQAFVHIEALAVFDEEIQQEVLKSADSTMDLPSKIVTDLQNTNGYTNPILQSFEGAKGAESSATESIDLEDHESYEALENAKRLSLGQVGEEKDDKIRCTSSRHHGSLSAEAIAKSPFEWWVRMVTLRACEAPKSQIQAESALNLARAFMVAGVPCVIMSHWLPSDPAATSVLFGQLYRLMKEGDDVSTALRRSMLRMLEDGVGMEQWGAYSVLGLPTVRLPDDMLVRMSGKEKITD